MRKLIVEVKTENNELIDTVVVHIEYIAPSINDGLYNFVAGDLDITKKPVE